MAQGNGADTGSPELVAALTALLQNVQPPKRKAKGKGGSKKTSTPEQKAERMAANDAECVKVFTEAGFKDVQPRINVMTYQKFIDSGRLVRKGEKSHRVGPFNLFHIDQTDVIPAGDAGTKH